jgi:peptide/nickel transport system substrate-binding protein
MRFARPAMKIAVFAAVGATALAACGKSTSSGSGGSGSSSTGLAGAYGSVPSPKTGTEYGGTVTVAAPPATSPSWILPLITGADNSVYTVTDFGYQMYRPLYWFVNGVAPTQIPAMSLANLPTYSNGDKTVSFTLKSNYKWSDGQPLTSKDVLFWWDIMKAAIKESPANWADFTPGIGIPDEVSSITAPNASTITMHLTKAVNPSWFTEDEIGAIQPMPAHAWARDSANGPLLNYAVPANAAKIYNYLANAAKPSATWATSPLWKVVDGPYKLTAFNVTTGAWTMVPNTTYGGPHAKVELTVKSVPFTSDDAEVNAVKAKAVDVGYFPLTNFREIGSVNSTAGGYNAFGYPDFGWTYAAYNFKDTTGDFNHIIGQLYIRQAIAHLENEPGYIKAFFFGAGGPAYGPVPSEPKSPYTPSNALVNPYPYSISAAASLLKGHGWKVVAGGTDTCTKPGTAADECGAGIPAGTKLAFPVVYGTSPAVIGEQITNLASEASKVGVQMHLVSSNFNFIVENDNDPAAPKDDNKWAMEDFGGFTDGTYPTTLGVFNSTGSSNLGGYASAEADKLIQASITSSNPDAVKNEAAYLTTQQPGLFQPNPDSPNGAVAVWVRSLSGTKASFENMTQFDLTPEYWYFTSKQ